MYKEKSSYDKKRLNIHNYQPKSECEKKATKKIREL